MDGLTGRRADGRLLRRWTITGAIVLLSVGPTARPSVGQVGHDPANSPYRDILKRSGPVLFVGQLSGDRGRAQAGPSAARTFGARYELPAGRSLVLQFTAAYLAGDRFIIDPAADSTDPARRTGPVDAPLMITDVTMQLRLTGSKTWHGLAPFVGVGLGLVFDVSGDSTSSGYGFGTKLTFAGATGVRWHAGPRLTVVADARAQMWRLRYPVSYHTPAPDGSRVVPLADPLTDWTLHPWLSLGVGWTF